MVDAPNQGATGDAPPAATDAWGTPQESPLSVETEGGPLAGHPEVLVGGAFIGGLALAILVRRIGR
ncbi:MAG: hypothetical protein JW895_07775 [Thermoleophilaceae bacterium]|nr:hypothetical protein [Thermoleophilaceae bacterium]